MRRVERIGQSLVNVAEGTRRMANIVPTNVRRLTDHLKQNYATAETTIGIAMVVVSQEGMALTILASGIFPVLEQVVAGTFFSIASGVGVYAVFDGISRRSDINRGIADRALNAWRGRRPFTDRNIT